MKKRTQKIWLFVGVVFAVFLLMVWLFVGITLEEESNPISGVTMEQIP